MSRALSVTDLLNKRYTLVPFEGPWQEAFGNPENRGVWFIWGNSTNGKTSFVVALIRELARYYRVIYDSLEEGDAKSMQDAFLRAKMDEVKRRVQIVEEPVSDLSERLLKPKSPEVVVIDSIQYTDLNFKRYLALRRKHPNKLLIFTSHAEGKEPYGGFAKQVKYNAGLKIWVEGYKAFSQGRSIGPVGSYTIYDKGASDYWEKHEK